MSKHSKLLLLMVAAVAYGATIAAETSPRSIHWMSGERLLALLQPVGPAAVPWVPGSKLTREELAAHHTVANTEYVRGYVAALHDASEGKSWCYNSTYKSPKPDTFWDESRWGVAKLTPAQLKRNAADLLDEIWRQKWPCPSS